MFYKKAKKALAGEKGFTMVELIVVIVIIGVLTALISVNMLKYVNDGKVKICMQECMECVASAQTLLVEHYNYGTSFEIDKIKSSAGVDGTINYIRVADREVTHLYYTKGEDTYVYCRYYDELDLSSEYHGHHYGLVDPDDPTRDMSLEINDKDIENGIDDLYTYVDYDPDDGEGIDGVGAEYEDDDEPNTYDDEDPEQPTDEEETTTETTTTAPIEEQVEVTTSQSSFYSKILEIMFKEFRAKGSNGQREFDSQPIFPLSEDIINDNGKSYCVYSHEGTYYVMLYDQNGIRVDLHAGSIHYSETEGIYNEGFINAGKSNNFDGFVATWEECGYETLLKGYIKRAIIENSQFVSWIQQGKIVPFTFNGSCDKYDTEPESAEEGTVISVDGKLKVYITLQGVTGWYTFVETAL